MAHVSLWVDEKKRERKLQLAQRKKIVRQLAWQASPQDELYRPESAKSINVDNYFNSSSSSSNEDDTENDNQSLQSYGPLKPGLKCCPERSSCKDCYCHWSRSGENLTVYKNLNDKLIN